MDSRDITLAITTLNQGGVARLPLFLCQVSVILYIYTHCSGGYGTLYSQESELSIVSTLKFTLYPVF